MAKVTCTCGRSYTIPDRHLGKQVKCAACQQSFVAVAAEAPTPKAPRAIPVEPAPPAEKLRIGDLAVARGLLTREQLNASLRYVESVRKLPGQDDLRLGAVLVSKRLLTRAQLDGLLRDQHRGFAAAAAAAIDLTPSQPARSTPVTEEQRELLRRSVAAASQQLAEKEAASAAAAAARQSLPSRIRARHVGIAVCVAFAALLALALWPAPAPQRVLEAYLESCEETVPAPDPDLAVTDLSLVVREFSRVTLRPRARYGYAEELAQFTQEGGKEWIGFLETAPLSDAKYEALALLLPAMPLDLTPSKVGGLEITVQPILCHLVFRQRGMGMFAEGNYRFVVLKAKSPSWQCGWKVAGYEPASSGR